MLPEGGPVGFYSDWRNGGRGGPPAWETFHLRELRGLLERDFGAGRRRAIAGLSWAGWAPWPTPRATRASSAPPPPSPAWSTRGRMRRSSSGSWEPSRPTPGAVWGDPARDRATWAAHDPTTLAPRLRGTRLFVASGDGRRGPFDRPGRPRDGIEAMVGAETRSFVARLRALRLPRPDGPLRLRHAHVAVLAARDCTARCRRCWGALR